MRVRFISLAALLGLTLVAVPAGAQQGGTQLRQPDVIYVPTPQEVVDAMLQLANVTAKDVVYDLGSGDGRIPITAAQKHGARGVGIDINPERIKEANENLAKADVGNKVKFLNADLFESDFGEATVVTLYLLPSLNLKLMPKLKELKPGTRIVSHSFDMGSEWPPEKTQDVNGRTIYLWTIK
jgi:tRNA G37 N-methylase Trm5